MKEIRPPQFKLYAGAPLPLPRELPVADTGTLMALNGAEPSLEGPLDAALLARILFRSAGVVRYLTRENGSTEWYRAAGSSGNLSPLELYLVSGEVGDLAAGVYHYEPISHALALVRPGDSRLSLATATVPGSAPTRASIVVTGIPWRAGWKYQERGLRNIYRDAGTMLSQILALAASASATAPTLHLGFVDRTVTEILEIDGVHEFPVAVVDLGPPDPEPRGSAVGPGIRGSLGPASKEFPLITEVQRAGDLSDANSVRRWRIAAATLDLFDAPGRPRPEGGEGLEESIRQRGSTRRFQRRTAPKGLLEGLAIALRTPPSDAIPDGRTMLEHTVLAHDIEGVDPGIYRYRDGELHLVRAGDARALATELCVDQSLAGDGACAVFHAAPLERILGALGDRGYRALLLESGLAGGRSHLVARANGLGASGLTFYDHVARERLDLETYPQLVTTIGVPAYHPRPGGVPGDPVRLRAIPGRK